ncbi:acid protease [Cristinia sonorae]|uniref:Acid protease n=1 Tax=Cristinia sonorae TaxID=1940300 RepID=A0A8K0UX25_9AGAR|nr:acid protease [Cristinia sonorae]
MLSALHVLSAIVLAPTLDSFFMDPARFIAGVYAQGGVKIPIQRISKPQKKTPAHILSSNVSVANSHEFAYLASVQVGGQDFLALLDTGSSDLWVVTSDCTLQDCSGVPKYTPSSSLNLMADVPFNLNYLMGSVSGTVATETVTLGPFQISSQVLGLANGTSGLGLTGTGNSGILGLSFPLEAAIPDTAGMTLLDNVLSTFDEGSRFFAFKLGRDQISSSFTIGQVDTAFANDTSEFTFTPVDPASGTLSKNERYYDYWKIPIQKMTINGTAFELSPSRVAGAKSPIAVMDTGTTLVLGPSADVDRFYTSIGGTRKMDDMQGGQWQIRCDRAAAVGFVLGEGEGAREYGIDPMDLAWVEGGREGDWCTGGVQANDGVSSGDWLLGDTFLRNVYAIHQVATGSNPPRIGLMHTTNMTAALEEFTRERGPDPTPPAPILSAAPSAPHTLGTAAIWGISGASGYVFGLCLALLISYCVAKRSKK